MAALNDLVSQAVDVVVHGPHTGRTEVNQSPASSLTTGESSTQFTLTEVFRRDPHTDVLRWTGQIPVRAAVDMAAAGYDIRSILPIETPPPTRIVPGDAR